MSLDISNFIEVSVLLTPVGLSNYNVNNVALFTRDTPIPSPYGDYGVYTSAAAVGTDFGTTSETYLQAVALFSQQPNILAGGGSLIIFPFAANVAGTIHTAVIDAVGSGYHVNDILTVAGGTGGTFKVTAIGGAGEVLAIQQVAVGAGYSATTNHATTVAPSGGTACTISITAILNTETLAQAIARTAGLTFYVGILSTDYGVNTTWKACADIVQAYQDKMIFFPSNASADIAGAFTDIKTAADGQARCLFYGGTALQARLFAAAYAGRGMCVNFAGSKTANTMNLKTLITITSDSTLTQTIIAACITAGVDVYGDFGGVAKVMSNGANRFFDQVFNQIWFVSQLKVNGFNVLAQTTSKIPQTEPGMNVLKGAYRQVCDMAVNNGYLAPGAWTSPDTFGNQEDFVSNVLLKGYYIYSQPVNLQNAADRAARKAPLVQLAVKEAGSIHNTIINVYDNV